jgi:hypothetical protein
MRTLVMVGCLSAAATAARAQLWSTGGWDGQDGRASDRSTPAVRPETRAADDFVLAAGNGQNYAITGLSGRALARIYTGAFAEVYADVAGVPGAAPVATLAASGVQVVQSGVFGQYDLIDVTINTAGLSLAPGRWWVSIVCDVSGDPPPNDGYGFFATGGAGVVQGLQGRYRVGTGPWLPITQAIGFPSDFSFTVIGQQSAPACYANCDSSTIPPLLNVADFVCFLNAFASGESYANCDGSTIPPALNIADFLCYLNAFAAGCS